MTKKQDRFVPGDYILQVGGGVYGRYTFENEESLEAEGAELANSKDCDSFWAYRVEGETLTYSRKSEFTRHP